MKKLAIIFVLLLLLAGGGAGGAYYMGFLDSLLGIEETPEEIAAREAKAKKAAMAEMTYVPLDPFAAPVVEGRKVTRQVLLTLSLQVPSLAAKNDVVSVLPRLRDAMLTDLYARPVISLDDSGAIDIAGVKQRMLAIARKVVGKDKIHNVLVIKALQTS